MIDNNRMTPELCAVFVARFIEPSTTLNYLGSIATSACRACNWVQSSGTSKRFRESIERRFGNVFSMHGKNYMAPIRFNAAFTAARKWGNEHKESALNWPGDFAPQPEQPVLPCVGELVVVDTISTEQVAKKLRAMSNTLAIFSQTLERLMEERQHNSMQLLDACREFASDQRMLRDLVDSILPGGKNATTD